MKWTFPCEWNSAVFCQALSECRQETDQGLWPDSISLSISVQVLSSLPDRVTIWWAWELLLTQFWTPSWRTLLMYYLFYFPCLLLVPMASFSFFSINNSIFLEMVDMIWLREILSKGLYFFLQEIQHTLSFLALPHSCWLWRLPWETPMFEVFLHLKFCFHSSKSFY